MHKYLNLAIRCAIAHDYDKQLKYQLCAILVKGGQIVSIGYNRWATNSFMEHYTNLVRGKRDYSMSTHAELDCVHRVRSKVDLQGSKIYIARIKRTEEIGIARPCPICETVLTNYGIKRAYYTISDNDYGVMTPNNIIL